MQKVQQLIQKVKFPTSLNQMVLNFKRLWLYIWKRKGLFPIMRPDSGQSS